MQKINKTVFINAPKEKVWDIMLGEQTYREWTNAFYPGSYYKGEWKEGTDILFLGPDSEGKKEAGMKAHIDEIRPYEYVGMTTVCEVADGEDAPFSEGWENGIENYTFVEKDGGTELSVEVDISEEMKDMMSESWDTSLAKLKEISEK